MHRDIFGYVKGKLEKFTKGNMIEMSLIEQDFSGKLHKEDC